MTIDGVLPARLTSRSIVAGLGALAVLVTLTSCGGEADVEPVSTTSASAPTPAVPSPTETTPSPISNASPYSGLPNGLGKPVLAVKIDNTGAAQPHAGLELADLVYVEEVEWGLNRLLASFSTQMPDVRRRCDRCISHRQLHRLVRRCIASLAGRSHAASH